MEYHSLLSTIDNPYNPTTHFPEWFLYDIEKGYNTCEYLDRIAITSDSMSDEEYNAAIEEAIDEIIKNDFRGIYIKVSPDVTPNHTGEGS